MSYSYFVKRISWVVCGEEKQLAYVFGALVFLLIGGVVAFFFGEWAGVVVALGSFWSLLLFNDIILSVVEYHDGYGVQKSVKNFVLQVLAPLDVSQVLVTLPSGKQIRSLSDITGSDVSRGDLFEARSVIPPVKVLKLLYRSAFALAIVGILGVAIEVCFLQSGAVVFARNCAFIWLSLAVFIEVYWVSYARYALYQHSREGFVRYMNSIKLLSGWYDEVLRIAFEAGWVKGTRIRSSEGVTNDRRRPGAPREDV
jgi:hypothetical protein